MRSLKVICDMGIHCVECRRRDGEGHLWRESLGRSFALPGGDVDFECPRGVPWGVQQQQPAASAAVPRDKWPLRVKVLARLASLTDKGVGDTLERIVRHVGGDAFKRGYKWLTGEDCGCANRQAKLNATYPY